MYTKNNWASGDTITEALIDNLETQFEEATEPNAASVSISGGTLTLNLNTAKYFYASLNANITSIVLQNLAGSGRLESFILELTADGTPRTVAPFGSAPYRWSGGSVYSPTSTNGKKDLLAFMTRDNGTIVLATIIGLNM